MSLCFCSRTKSDTRNAVSSHDGNAVCRERPFVSQWAGFSHLSSLWCSNPFFSVKSLVGFFQSFCDFVVFWNDPGREVAFDRIYQSGIGWSVIVVHGNRYILPIFLYAWKCTDLIQTAFPCLSGSHTAIQRNRAGVCNRTAAWRSEENFRSCDGTPS